MEALSSLMDLFSKRTGNMPNWIWIVVIGGGIGLYLLSRRAKKGTALTAADTGNPAGTSASANDPNIDPNTGVPYTVEEMTNPSTGVPFYYTQGSPATTSGQPDYAAILAALQDIDNKIGSTQGNPSGQGGVGIGANPPHKFLISGAPGTKPGVPIQRAMQSPPRPTSQPVLRRY